MLAQWFAPVFIHHCVPSTCVTGWGRPGSDAGRGYVHWCDGYHFGSVCLTALYLHVHVYMYTCTVDREIFSSRNFRLLNFRVKIFSSLQHTDENYTRRNFKPDKILKAFTVSVHLRTWIESPLGSGRETIGSTHPFASHVYSLNGLVPRPPRWRPGYDATHWSASRSYYSTWKIFRVFLIFDVENISRVKISTLEAPTKYF